MKSWVRVIKVMLAWYLLLGGFCFLIGGKYPSDAFFYAGAFSFIVGGFGAFRGGFYADASHHYIKSVSGRDGNKQRSQDHRDMFGGSILQAGIPAGVLLILTAVLIGGT